MKAMNTRSSLSKRLKMRRHDRDEAQVERQLPRRVAFVRSVHQQMAGHRQRRSAVHRLQQRAALGRIARLSG
jgi:hypothetical protein